jgi:GxxExxY protein
MDADAHGLESDLTETVIGSAFEISRVLGAGFLEKVYERALLRELMLRGVRVKSSSPVSGFLQRPMYRRIHGRSGG